MLLLFALHWHLFPVIGSANMGNPLDRLDKLVLPSTTLGIVMSAYITRVTRSAMLAVLGEDYIRTARAKGVPWRRVVWHHALRNAAMPVVTVVGLYIGILIGNSVLTEIVFNRPGLGKHHRRRAEQPRLHHAAGPDGDLLLPDRRGEPDHRPDLRADRSAGEAARGREAGKDDGAEFGCRPRTVPPPPRSASPEDGLHARRRHNPLPASRLCGIAPLQPATPSALLCVIVVGAVACAVHPNDQNIVDRFQSPGADYLLGTDSLRPRRAVAHPVRRAHLAAGRGRLDRRPRW